MAFAQLAADMTLLAFDIAGDLVTDVILTNRAASGYNFSTGVATTSTDTVNVRGIVTTLSRPDRENPHLELEVYFKTSEIGELDGYDSISVQGQVYKLATFVREGPLTIAKLSKEV